MRKLLLCEVADCVRTIPAGLDLWDETMLYTHRIAQIECSCNKDVKTGGRLAMLVAPRIFFV